MYVFNFAILLKLRKFDAGKIYVFWVYCWQDYVDAFDKLLQLTSKQTQSQREAVHIVVKLCLNERTFNKYYAHLLDRLCSHHRQLQVLVTVFFSDYLWYRVDCHIQAGISTRRLSLSGSLSTNSLSVALRAGYLSVRTAEGASEKQSSLKARLRNGLTYLLTLTARDETKTLASPAETRRWSLVHLESGD